MDALALKSELEQLSGEQQRVVDLIVRERRSVFVTGSAGTGKSRVLSVAKKASEAANLTVGLTAPTGAAALLIGGQTIHRFSGIEKANQSAAFYIAKMAAKGKKKMSRAWHNIRETNVLFIDECPMIPHRVWKLLDEVYREVRRRPEEPFGGMQIVALGDFLQLPPVDRGALYLFQTREWTGVFVRQIELKQIFRQKDARFIGLLQRMRVGELTQEDLDTLRSRVGIKLEHPEGMEPLLITSLNAEVDQRNQRGLDALPGPRVSFEGIMEARHMDADGYQAEDLKKNCNAPRVLQLKVGAHVRFLLNRPDGSLWNGTSGVVIGFKKNPPKEGTSDSRQYLASPGFAQKWDADHTEVTVRFETGLVETVKRNPYMWVDEYNAWKRLIWKQFPLALNYAQTVHRSQGMSVQRAYIAMKTMFECGMAYTALSRVCSLEGVGLLDFDPRVIRADKPVVEYYRNLESLGYVQPVREIPKGLISSFFSGVKKEKPQPKRSAEDSVEHSVVKKAKMEVLDLTLDEPRIVELRRFANE